MSMAAGSSTLAEGSVVDDSTLLIAVPCLDESSEPDREGVELTLVRLDCWLGLANMTMSADLRSGAAPAAVRLEAAFGGADGTR